MSDFTYTGNELGIFAQALNWKRYFSRVLLPFIRGHVLEVGAGNGNNTALLLNSSVSSWTCLEPDTALAASINEKKIAKNLPDFIRVITGTSLGLSPSVLYDCILYIDVLEHIENDVEELNHVKELLKPDGILIILAPAFNNLYSAFDKEIGHYRRYTKYTLRKAIPAGFKQKKLLYLDSMGFFASTANKLLFNTAKTKPRVIMFWDRVLIPISRVTDALLFHRFGKSLIGIWQKST